LQPGQGRDPSNELTAWTSDLSEIAGTVDLPGRLRKPERPLGVNRRPNVVTAAAWDTIGLHDKWVATGFARHLSEGTLEKLVSNHFNELTEPEAPDTTSRDPNVSHAVCRSGTPPANLRLAHAAMDNNFSGITEGRRLG
jgi:hypothetical protein